MIAASKPHEFTGAPEPGSGIKLMSPEEVVGLMSDPRWRRAIDIVEKDTGQKTAARQLTYYACQHHRVLDSRMRREKRIIDIARKKNENKGVI